MPCEGDDDDLYSHEPLVTRPKTIAAVSSSISRSIYQTLRIGPSKRDLVRMELISTEESYVCSLRFLRECYIAPMRNSLSKQSLDITREDFGKLAFPSVEMILGLHESFLPRLKKTDLIGDFFLKFGDFFKMYTAYVNEADTAIATLDSATYKESKKFQTFLEEVRKSDRTRATLKSYLITPIQRIPRYWMLLKELKKNTPKTHKDYSNLESAVERLHLIAMHINEAKRRADSDKKFLQLQKRIKGYPRSKLLLPTRRLLREGRLHKIMINSRSCCCMTFFTNKEEVLVYLFNDIVLLVTPGYTFRALIALEGSTWIDKQSSATDNSFSVYGPDGFGYRLVCRSQQAKKLWCSDIQRAINSLKTVTITALSKPILIL